MHAIQPIARKAERLIEAARDRSLSAQFEHSVGITADGVEIFTLSERTNDKPWAAV